jgi:hypothetical protein
VFIELDDGTAVELQTYPRAGGPGVQIGLKGRFENQAQVLGISTGRPAKQNKGA